MKEYPITLEKEEDAGRFPVFALDCPLEPGGEEQEDWRPFICAKPLNWNQSAKADGVAVPGTGTRLELVRIAG